MAKVVGIGGIFFKCKDPAALGAWYKKHLGIDIMDNGEGGQFWNAWDKDAGNASTVLGLFKQETEYFKPSGREFMFNLRVDDLKGILERLRAEGVDVDDKMDEYEYGNFGWINDPEGNRIELWEPKGPAPE